MNERSRVDDKVGIPLWHGTAEQLVALFRFTGMTIGILDFASKNGLLASGAIPNSTAEIEVNFVFLAQRQEIFFFSIPFFFHT